MARPFFSRERVADLLTIGKHADMAVDIISRSTEAINIQDLFSRLTVDTTFEFIFGRQLQSLTGFAAVKSNASIDREGAFTDFLQAIDDVQVRLHQRFITHPLWFAQELFCDGMSRPMTIIHRYLDPILDEVFTECGSLSQKGVAVNLDEATMAHYIASNINGLSSSISLVAASDTATDREAVRDELITMMFAGRDTVCRFAFVF